MGELALALALRVCDQTSWEGVGVTLDVTLCVTYLSAKLWGRDD
jgi:hypothetical protein